MLRVYDFVVWYAYVEMRDQGTQECQSVCAHVWRLGYTKSNRTNQQRPDTALYKGKCAVHAISHMCSQPLRHGWL